MKKSIVAGATLLSLALASAVLAEDQPARVVRTPDLIGKTVVNRNNESLGRVEDFVINIKDGTIAYGVLANGQTLGFGGKMFAISPKSMSLTEDGRHVMVDMPLSKIEAAKGFDANHWPTEATTSFAPAREDEKTSADRKDNEKDMSRAHLRRVSALNGLTIQNPAGEKLGSVGGMALDLTNGRVVYVALAHGGVAGVGSKYFAIGWDALKLSTPDLKSRNQIFVLDASPKDLDNRKGFDTEQWPVKPDTTFVKGS